MHTASTSAICALKLYQGNNKYNIRQYLAIQVEPSRWTCLHLECLKPEKKVMMHSLCQTPGGEKGSENISFHTQQQFPLESQKHMQESCYKWLVLGILLFLLAKYQCHVQRKRFQNYCKGLSKKKPPNYSHTFCTYDYHIVSPHSVFLAQKQFEWHTSTNTTVIFCFFFFLQVLQSDTSQLKEPCEINHLNVAGPI